MGSAKSFSRKLKSNANTEEKTREGAEKEETRTEEVLEGEREETTNESCMCVCKSLSMIDTGLLLPIHYSIYNTVQCLSGHHGWRSRLAA